MARASVNIEGIGEDSVLVIRLPINSAAIADAPLSQTGKTYLVHSINEKVGNGISGALKLNLNLYRKA